METALTLGSLVPAGVGLGCCVHRRSHWLGVGAMVVMLCGMGDVMLPGIDVLPAAGWVVVFALAAAAQVVADGPTRTMRVAELGVMALLIALMPPMTVGPGSGMTMHHASDAGQVLSPLLAVLGSVAVAGFLAYAGSRLAGDTSRTSRLEVGMSVVSVCAMGVMVVAGAGWA